MSRMQFSMRDLFGLTIYFSLLAWLLSCSISGDSFLLVFVWVLTALNVGTMAFFAVGENRRIYGPVVSIVIGAIFLSLGPAMDIPAALSLVASVYFAFAKSVCSIRHVLVVAVICQLVALSVPVWVARLMFQKYLASRIAYPVESMEGRLQYEQRLTHDETDALRLTKEIDSALHRSEDDGSFSFTRREYMLRQLHDQSYERFVWSSGFGVGRMVRFSPDALQLPEPKEIAFSKPTADEDAAVLEKFKYSFRNMEPTSELPQFHQTNRNLFVLPDSLGLTLTPVTAVVGFDAHAFRVSPLAFWQSSESLSIDRLELISLLKFDSPRVYVSEHLPRMDKLSSDDVPTRPLDAFEISSLEKLRETEDVVVEEVDGKIRMAGSLRAQKQCQNCHRVNRGELLGVFSYRLTLKAQPNATKKD